MGNTNGIQYYMTQSFLRPVMHIADNDNFRACSFLVAIGLSVLDCQPNQPTSLNHGDLTRAVFGMLAVCRALVARVAVERSNTRMGYRVNKGQIMKVETGKSWKIREVLLILLVKRNHS